MNVGIHLPQWGPGASREGLVTVARAAEAAGLDSLWVADHVVSPAGVDDDYPGKSLPFTPDEGILEGLTALAVAAGVTSRVTLGTSVLVLPQRNTVLTAKTIATLDVLSEGRVAFGVGAGWWKAEFDALGAPFAKRGKRLDEQIEALRLLWTGGAVSYAGAHVEFGELTCRPRPRQPGGPPVLVGGTSAPALARAGRLGDGWHATGSHTDMLREGIAGVRAAAEAAGRDPGALTFSTSVAIPLDAEHLVRRLSRLEALGLDRVVVDPGSHDPDVILRAIELVATHALPRLAGTAPTTS